VSDVPAWYEGHQTILNAHDVPDRYSRARIPIPVTARVMWEVDGDELLDTVPDPWTRTLVLVEVPDGRWHLAAAWIPAGDVRRR